MGLFHERINAILEAPKIIPRALSKNPKYNELTSFLTINPDNLKKINTIKKTKINEIRGINSIYPTIFLKNFSSNTKEKFIAQ